MKRLISIILTVVMLASMLVTIIPASAATVTTATEDKPLKFKSGLDNLWYTDKKMTALPRTVEATIEVPLSQYDIFEGQVLAWYSEKSTTGHYIFVDLIRKDASHKDLWSNLGVRVIYKNGSTEVQKVFYNSLNDHLGKKTNIAITFDGEIKLYINGNAYTGASYFRNAADEAAAMAIYNSIDVAKLPALNVCGDDRAANAAFAKTNFPNYRYFKGGLYNVAVYSDVRTATEIKADATAINTEADNIILAYDVKNLGEDAKAASDLTGNGYDIKRTYHGKAFVSGFDNVYAVEKQVSALPKTFEAAIYVPTSADDQYWGDIMAWNDDNGDYIVWDLRDPPGTGAGKEVTVRFLVRSNGTGVTINFNDALSSYRGKNVHVALTINTTIKLYVNGVEFTGTVGGDATQAATLYNSLNLSNLRLPSVGGDFRAKIADSKYTVHHVDNYRWFRGKIFTVAAFTDVRSATEIAADIATLPVKNGAGVDNLLMSYDFFEETKTRIVRDKSGNGYNLRAPYKWTDPEDREEITDYSYSFAVIGDTQVITRDEAVQANNPHYNTIYKGHLAKLYDWIVNNQDDKNIQFAFHMGDVTDWSNAKEWDLTMENWAKMNGKLPYNVARGNHDGGPAMAQRYTTSMFTGNVVAGEEFGFFDGRGIANYETNTLNTYQTITVNGTMYLMMALDLGPCKAVIEWANEVIAAHPYHNVIISTHSYLQGDYTNNNYVGAEHYPYMDGDKDCAANQYNPGGKYNGGSYKDGNGNSVYWDYRLQQHKNGGENYLYQDATYMLNNLVKKHENISMVLCGHECSEYVKQISATGEAGNNVLQFLVDGQGVDADLRAETNHAGLVAMLYFSEDGKKVTTEYYSTIRDQYLHGTSSYDVNVTEVPAAVKEYYALMHSLKSNSFNAKAWAVIANKIEQTKQIVVSTSDMSVVEAQTAALAAVVETVDSLDYTAISNAISAAMALNELDYSVADWTAIQSAITTAEGIVLNASTQTELDNAAAALNQAVSGKTKLNRTALIKAIDEARLLKENEYSLTDWADISAAITAANNALTARTQNEIDSATAALIAAPKNKTKLDRTSLEAVIAEGDRLDASDYIESSWNTFIMALLDAKVKLTSRTQAEIDAATTALRGAIDSLQRVESDDEIELDLSGLEAAIEAAEKLAATEYTETTWNALSAALAAAKTALEESEDQTAIDAATKALTDAVSALKKNIETDDIATDEPESESNNTSELPEKSNGCGSAIAATAVVLTTVLALGFGMKKKED